MSLTEKDFNAWHVEILRSLTDRKTLILIPSTLIKDMVASIAIGGISSCEYGMVCAAEDLVKQEMIRQNISDGRYFLTERGRLAFEAYTDNRKEFTDKLLKKAEEDKKSAERTYAEYVTKDSGQRQDFSTGARRDVQDGKTRWDLIPPSALRRVADLFARGAEKYGESNYQKGIPVGRIFASMLRHVYAYREGVDDGEDHIAAVAWNALAIIFMEEGVEAGRLPEDLLVTDWTDIATQQKSPTERVVVPGAAEAADRLRSR